MKRFWTEARAVDGGVVLDTRPVRTPGRNLLVLPTAPLADAIAHEWNAVGEEPDPRALPLTGLANAAIDIVAPNPAAFALELAKFGESDLFAYRADAPAPLVRRQAEEWNPLLDWARGRYDIHVELATGIIHRPQPEATIERLRDAMIARDPFQLSGLSPIVTIGGSLIGALALAEQAVDPDTLWRAVMLDELWQEEQWGEDAFATQARDARHADWDSAARFLALLR